MAMWTQWRSIPSARCQSPQNRGIPKCMRARNTASAREIASTNSTLILSATYLRKENCDETRSSFERGRSCYQLVPRDHVRIVCRLRLDLPPPRDVPDVAESAARIQVDQLAEFSAGCP